MRVQIKSVISGLVLLGVGISIFSCGGDKADPGRRVAPVGGTPVSTGTAGQGIGASGAGGANSNFGNNTQGSMVFQVPQVHGGNRLGCKNLQCAQHDCNTGSTTISGTVYDPAGKNPIYNVAVYIPNETPGSITLGASCYSCSDLYTGKPVVATLTDPNGKFVLPMAPDGANMPLVIQIGKWRKQLTLPMVAPCQDNPIPDKMLRLPKNQMEGDIPRIAISTGGADTLECLLRRIGVDASEYTPGNMGNGRIHMYQGSDYMATMAGMAGGFPGLVIPGQGYTGTAPNTSPAAPQSYTALWDSVDHLMQYDIVLLSCEGQETLGMNQQALHDYASMGGRVFASHFHYAWFNTGPYSMENLATWTTGVNTIGDVNANIATMLPNGAAFPKGMALKQWLGNVNALKGDELPISAARHNADVSAMNTPSTTWITADNSAMAPGAVQYFSFNTPTDAAIAGPDDVMKQCGRVVYSDLHVGAASGDDPSMASVPQSCTNVDLSPQEKALEFMLFDLSACLTPDDRPPVPPPPVQ
jgi:hypothetical protein